VNKLAAFSAGRLGNAAGVDYDNLAVAVILSAAARFRETGEPAGSRID